MAGNESQVQYHRRRVEDLKSIRATWEEQWQELAEFVEPTRLRLSVEEAGGKKNRRKIVDSSGTFAWRTCASGMHSGLTSPARPWFRLQTYDPDLKEYAPVKQYLQQVQERMREVFQGSNVYNAFHYGYGDNALFGQEASILMEDEQSFVHAKPLIHGSFWLARDPKGRADTLYAHYRWSAERIVREFGLESVSTSVRNCYERGDYDRRFVIWHAIEPRRERDGRRLDARNKPFLSNWWEDGGGDGNQLLRESGFDENPIIAPAWELMADDPYAVSPGMVALADVKMLQIEQTRKIEGIDKQVRPPMTGPTSMKNQNLSLLPGSVNYVDDPTGKGFRPAMEVRIDLQYLSADIAEVRDRCNRAWYADLFLMLQNLEGVQPRNQLELSQRNEEKLLQLGPVLENIYIGKLAPTIARTYNILRRRGALPPAPEELRGQALKIDYISTLAQAQKAVATGSIERLWSFAGNLAAVRPDVLDKLDADQTIDEYGDMLGAPASLIVSDDKVAELRQQRADAQQRQQSLANAAAMAPAAKNMADAAQVLTQASDQPGGSALLQRLGLQ